MRDRIEPQFVADLETRAVWIWEETLKLRDALLRLASETKAGCVDQPASNPHAPLRARPIAEDKSGR